MNDTKMRSLMEKTLKLTGFNPATAKLKFGSTNSKLKDIPTLSLPAGHSCPFAKDCRSCATIKVKRSEHTSGKQGKSCGFGIQDGPDTQWRCYTAIDEVMRPAVRLARWWNYLTLIWATAQGKQVTFNVITKSLPEATWGKPTRVHVSGDYFNQIYFDAWMMVAEANPNLVFYSYTKALPRWVKRLNKIPNNFKLVASRGGSHDYLIEKYNLRNVTVVTSAQEARMKGLPIDHDDSHAYGSDRNFALLIHGQQPAGTIFAKAWATLKKMGMGGYGKTIEKTTTAVGGK